MCLESGLTRSKNSINVAVKNLADFGLSVALFWAFGYALMFGASRSGWWGSTAFFFAPQDEPQRAVFFLYQAMFCGTATTIISGAVAERLKFSAYVLISSLVSGIVYPIFGHWAWNGIANDNSGWLEGLGFVDFAGSTVVHSTGAWVSLATLLVVGARTGRFPEAGSANKIQGSNMPFSVLGAFILWFGWIGFNGGSTLALDDRVPGIVMNTFLAGVAGMLVAGTLSWLRYQLIEVEPLVNGSIAGLVAITACCNVVTPPLAFIVGGTGAAAAMLVADWMTRSRIDDAVDAVAIHGGAGLWGTLCVALFGNLSTLDTGLSRGMQLLVQALGIGICFAWAFGISWIALYFLNRWLPLRVSEDEEALGLNVSEHRAKTETYDLFQVMDYQARTHDLNLRAPVEPFTEVGHIATRYNQVMDALEKQHRQNVEDLEQLYYLITAATAVVERETYQSANLELDEIASRDDDLGSLARVLQTLVQKIQSQELALNEAQKQKELSLCQAKRDAIAQILSLRWGTVPLIVQEQLDACHDSQQLQAWIGRAIAASSIEEFENTAATSP